MQGYVRRQLRVFLLDDHEIVRQGLRDLLSLHRDIYLVGDSGSARHASRVIPELKPDVMVLDLRLQDGTGVDVCRAVRSVDPSIRGLLLTSSPDDEALSSAILAGAAGYVIKVARSDTIVDAVRRVGDGKALMDPAVVEQVTREMREDMRRAEPPLTDDESQVLDGLLGGLTNQEIADRCGAAVDLVAADVARLIERLAGSLPRPEAPAKRDPSGRHRRPLS